MAKTSTFGVCLFQVLVIFLLPFAKALWLELPSSETKCVSEDLHTNVVVLTDYFILPDEEFSKVNVVPTMSISVTSPFGNNIHRDENVTHGQFAFTAPEAGNYLACFWMVSGSEVGKTATISIDWKTGFATKDWESVAKKEKIEGVELELRKLEGAVEAIRENLSYLKSREADMREVSERTNARVAWFSMMSLGVCIAVSLVQVWYLTRFFQKKKLI